MKSRLVPKFHDSIICHNFDVIKSGVALVTSAQFCHIRSQSFIILAIKPEANNEDASIYIKGAMLIKYSILYFVFKGRKITQSSNEIICSITKPISLVVKTIFTIPRFTDIIIQLPASTWEHFHCIFDKNLVPNCHSFHH